MTYKKITYVSRTSIPSRSANSIHVMKMCDALSRLGYKVSLLTDPIIAKKMSSDEHKIIDENEYYGVEKHFEIIKLYYPWIKKINGIIYSIFSFIWIIKNKTDLVFSRDLLCALLCGVLGYKVIYESHGISDSYFDKLVTKILIKYKRVDMFVSISNEMSKLLLIRYPELKYTNHLIAHDAVDLGKFNQSINKEEIRAKFQYAKKDFVIGYTGSLMQGRGIDVIINLAERLQGYKFFLAGGRENEIEYYKRYKKTKKINNLFIHGFLPNSELVKCLRICDLLLMPYQKELRSAGGKKINNTKWMSPLKMFEYMASGVPIISSEFKVLKEVLCHDHNAIFVDSENIDEWVSAIEKLHNDYKLRKKLSANARHDIVKYTWLNRAERIMSNFNAFASSF